MRETPLREEHVEEQRLQQSRRPAHRRSMVQRRASIGERDAPPRSTRAAREVAAASGAAATTPRQAQGPCSAVARSRGERHQRRGRRVSERACGEQRECATDGSASLPMSPRTCGRPVGASRSRGSAAATSRSGDAAASHERDARPASTTAAATVERDALCLVERARRRLRPEPRERRPRGEQPERREKDRSEQARRCAVEQDRRAASATAATPTNARSTGTARRIRRRRTQAAAVSANAAPPPAGPPSLAIARLSWPRCSCVIVRHAEAAPGAPDELRPLTPSGRDQARALGERLRAEGLAPDAVVSSPLLRARETATALGARRSPRSTSGSRPARRPTTSATPRTAAARLVVVVGHQPDCGQAAAALSGGPEPAFPPCGHALVELSDL